MLLFISDIHLTDRTAFQYSLNKDAVKKVFFNNLVSILERRPKVKDLTLVLLGDFFDLIRTKEWWVIRDGNWEPKKVTPWSENQDGIEEIALKILNGIFKNNKSFIEEIKTLPYRLSNKFPKIKFEKIIYIPGNHDRLITLQPLWNVVEGFFENIMLIKNGFFTPKDYKTLAFHGHQLDIFNREEREVPPFGDYTSSLITAIPYLIETEMSIKGFSRDIIESLKKRMLKIDDIRPESEIIPWLLSEAKKEVSLKDFFKEFIFKVLEMVTVDPFIRRWVDVHSKEFGIKDELFDLFLRVKGPKIFPLWGAKIFTLRYLERLSNSLRSRDGGDPYVNKLLKACNLEFSEKNMPYEFEIQEHMRDAECIVMGHTHGAKFVPLTSKVFYLNTGTWGKYMTQTISGDGFVSSRNLTFVIIYKEEEYKDRRFELWNVMDNKQ